MSKAKTLAGTVSTGGALANPSAIPVANITGLATVATSGSYNDLSDKPTITTTATNIAGGSAGTVPYQSASGTTAMLAAGTSGQFLKSNGAAAPSWGSVAINQSTLVADGAITAAGKALILTAAGKAKQSAIAAASYGANATFNAALTRTAATIFEPVAGVFLIAYADGADSNKGKIKIVTLDASYNCTFGSAFTFASSAISTGSLNMCFDPVTSQVLIAFIDSATGYGSAITAKVTGSNITFGTATNIGASSNVVGISYDLGVSKFLFSYRGGSAQYVRVGTVSGTSVSFSTATTVYGSSIDGYGAPAVYCPSISKHCIGYNTGGRGYIVQITIAPTTFAVTVGSAYPVTNGTGADGYLSGDHTLAWVDSLQRLLVIHGGGPSYNYYLQVTIFYVSGTSWLSSGYTTVDTGSYSAPYMYWPSIDYSESAGYAVISFVKQSTLTGYIAFSSVLTVSTISFGTQTQFQATATDMTAVALSTTNNKALVVAYDNSNPSPAADLNGTCRAGVSPIADNRTSFIGFATASAADGASVTFTTSFGVDTNQSGLTPNTTYYLDASNGSTLSTTSSGPKVAKAISATSVQVLGPNCA